MPLVKRKRTLLRALRDVAIAPFVFMLAAAYAGRYWLALIVVLMLSSIWMAGEPLKNLVPSQETVTIMAGVIVVISLAAVPLAIRDYFSNGGYETVWEPSPEVARVGREFAHLVVAADYESCYQRFSEELQSSFPLREFIAASEAMQRELGTIDAIDAVEEIPIPGIVFSNPDFRDTIDTAIEIVFRHQSDRQSVLLLYTNSRAAFQIFTFRQLELRDEEEMEEPET